MPDIVFSAFGIQSPLRPCDSITHSDSLKKYGEVVQNFFRCLVSYLFQAKTPHSIHEKRSRA